MNRMKKLWAVLLLLVASGQVFADEGMWVLKELNKQNLERMKELGFTPSYEQLYSETDPCVANAVVIFGGGCSGITVSNEGLIFTNHHCGFGSIQQLSSVEHDYLKDGFVSQSKEEELPVPGLTVLGLAGLLRLDFLDLLQVFLYLCLRRVALDVQVMKHPGSVQFQVVVL